MAVKEAGSAGGLLRAAVDVHVSALLPNVYHVCRGMGRHQFLPAPVHALSTPGLHVDSGNEGPQGDYRA